jgi:hypothetical protein
MLRYEKLTLLRHGETWIYHFPKQRQATIRCPRDNTWVTHTRTLFGAGLFHNATRCAITSGEIRTLPELHGVAHANIDAPAVYVPDSLPVLSAHELPRVEAALASEVNELDSSRPCFRKPDSHGLFGTTVRKCHFRHVRSGTEGLSPKTPQQASKGSLLTHHPCHDQSPLDRRTARIAD